MIGNRFTVATPEEKEVPSPSNRFTINKIPETTSNVVPKESTFARRVAAKYNVPETTIGKATPQEQPVAEEPSFWNKAARTVLPKGAEEYFGLSQPVQTAGDRVRQAEDRQQSYFRGQRKEENIAGVTESTEEYTPPTSFAGKLKEIFEYGGYTGNVWTGFIKPAIGTVGEQLGLEIHNPKLREWGEQFSDTVLEKEKRRASAQSMADVPGAFEGGLKDPRFYSKTMSQAVGFMSAILGTSIAVTAVTRNPLVGVTAAYAVGGALEGSSAYRSMLEKGVSPEDANTAAQIYGTIATIIENSTGIRPAGGLKGLTEDFAVGAAKNSGVKNFFKKWAEEGILEEGSQQLVQNLVTKFVDENQKVFDGVLESMVSGTIGALPAVGGGAVIAKSKELYEGMTPEERQAGFAKVPGVPEETLQQEAKKFESADEFIKKVDDERITFKTKDGKFSVTVTESTPEYELVDDITQSQLEKLGLDSDDFITKIEHIEVDKSLQGKGLGTKLMNRAIKETIENGHDFVYLNASPMGNKGLSLDGLTKFYEEFGFKIIKKQGNNNLMGATKSQLKDIYNKANKPLGDLTK